MLDNRRLRIHCTKYAKKLVRIAWHIMDNSSEKSHGILGKSRRLIALLALSLDRHSSAIFSLLIRSGGVLAGFAVTYQIGSTMGAAANGQFALISQTAMFLAVVGLVGLDVGVVRHFTKTVAENMLLSAGTILKVCALALGLMLVIGAVLWLAGDVAWQPLFGDTVPKEFLLVLFLLLVARGGTLLFGGLLRSQHRFSVGQAIATFAMPATTALALVTGLASSVEEALWATAIGGAVAILAAVAAMGRHVGHSRDAVYIPLKSVLRSSVPLWGVGIANNLGDWYGLAITANMFGAADAGLYRVAVQLAASLQIISMALLTVYSAKISTAFHAGNIAQVALLARSAVRLSTLAVVPAALLLIFGSEFLLRQIGDEFVAALPLVLVLVVGQLAFTLTAPGGLVLAMSGNERINFAISVVGASLLLVSVPIAASLGGIEGVAVCISIVMLLRNLVAYLIVRNRLGINIWAGSVNAAYRGV